MRRFSLVVVAVLLASVQARAVESTPEAQAALDSLKKLVEGAKPDAQFDQKVLEGLQRIGFSSRDEVLKAELAAPVSVYAVPLDKLRGYRSGSDNPADLLTAIESRIFPVTVDRAAKAAVFFDQGKLSGYGSPHLTRALAQVRAQLVEKTQLPEGAFFLVQVPALNVRLLGHYDVSRSPITDLVRPDALAKAATFAPPSIADRALVSIREPIVAPIKVLPTKRLMLTPLNDVELPANPREERFVVLKQGVTRDADSVFRALVEPAANLDASVPN